LGDKLYTSQLEDEKFELLHPENTVICQVRTSRASMALPEDEEVAEGEEGEAGPEGAEGTEGTEGAETPKEDSKEDSKE
jgi:large subunit ribosomal protein L25